MDCIQRRRKSNDFHSVIFLLLLWWPTPIGLRTYSSSSSSSPSFGSQISNSLWNSTGSHKYFRIFISLFDFEFYFFTILFHFHSGNFFFFIYFRWENIKENLTKNASLKKWSYIGEYVLALMMRLVHSFVCLLVVLVFFSSTIFGYNFYSRDWHLFIIQYSCFSSISNQHSHSHL